MTPPEAFESNENVYGATPPLAVNACEPFGARVALVGLMASGVGRCPTCTVAVAVTPLASVTRTMSMVPPLSPAVYAPSGVMVAPEAFVWREKA